MRKGVEQAAGGSLSLKFLSGKSQGDEYVIEASREVIVGRNSDADLILTEGMVSRYHARFLLAEGELTVEDLGSTNGTFVNGQRVRKRVLKEADRVLIGDCILKVVANEVPVETSLSRPEEGLFDEETTNLNLVGLLEDEMVSEVLELFAASRQAATLRLKSAQGSGDISLQDGNVVGATLDELANASPRKCFYRLLGWTKGSYVLEAFREPEPSARLDQPIPLLLLEGLHKANELDTVASKLPEDGRIVLAKPLLAPLRALDDAELDLLQSAHNLGLVSAVLDEFPQPDLEVAESLLGLLESGYLRRG